jgi:hypothetical protein
VAGADSAGLGRAMSSNNRPTQGARRGAGPVLIVVPSIVSGMGVAFILVAVLVDQQVVRDIFLSLGVILLWLDFFITMAIFRYTVRSIDRRLRAIEERLSRD